jgi:hypothetical protein
MVAGEGGLEDVSSLGVEDCPLTVVPVNSLENP